MSTEDPLRQGAVPTLAAALQAQRARTLALFGALRRELGEACEVPMLEVINPPRWELGHQAWFEEFWLARNSERWRGCAARLEAPRGASLLPRSDALYDSSAVAHAGSVFAYASEGLGRTTGFMAGWLAMLDYLLIPSVAYLFSGIALHALVPSVPAWVFTLIAFAATDNYPVWGYNHAAWVQIDGEFAAPVPEPATVALMLAGLGLTALASRRRKKVS